VGARRTDYLSFVEACYGPASDDRSWSDALLQRAAPLLDMGPGLGLTLIDESASGTKVLVSRGIGVGAETAAALLPTLERLQPEDCRRLFYPKQPVTFLSPLLGSLPQEMAADFAGVLRRGGVVDKFGMLGYPTPGTSFVMFACVGKKRGMVTSVRAAMRRLRMHLEAGLRLRLSGTARAMAVLNADGVLLHREPQVSEYTSERLGQQVRAIEKSRRRRERQRYEALDVWTALVEGRWSLVERIERDGKRYYYAYENAPRAQVYRALTRAEAMVLEQSIRGLQAKSIAYTTGLQQSRISECLAIAAYKLGFRSRADLVRVGARLSASGQLYALDDSSLTSAERDVLRLVRQGHSNREIARERGRSEATISAQIASLLRKTGASGRRGLIAGHVPEWVGEW